MKDESLDEAAAGLIVSPSDEGMGTTAGQLTGLPTSTPLYFGPAERPLLGWLHLPISSWSGARVIICSPLGYEGLFAYPALRELALRLVLQTRAAVLRFDYDGTGDSAGSDEDPLRVEHWLHSIDAAIDEIKHRAPSDGPVILIAMRAGALLAASAASKRKDISGLVLWAPSTSGRAFVREQKAFASMAHATASASSVAAPDWGDGGFEANGYVFSSETVATLSALALEETAVPPAGAILVLERRESPARTTAFATWREQGAVVDLVTIPDYPEMLAPPLTSISPVESIERIVEWVASLAGTLDVKPFPVARELKTRVLIAPDVIEEAVWYDKPSRRFGILTQPANGSCKTAMIFLNNAAGYRVGPHGMVPIVARALASEGIASFRVDAAGLGDSLLPDGRLPHHPYNLDALDDVRAVLGTLSARGFTRMAAGGLCSAAFLAWQAAQAFPEIQDLVLINPQTFHWTLGDSLDVSPLQDQYAMDHYSQSARSAEKWRKLLRGEVNLAFVAQLVLKRAIGSIGTRFRTIATRLGLGRVDSAASRTVQSIAARGGTVSFIFSGDDPGYGYLLRELGGNMRALMRLGALQLTTVDGPDHSFTARWATRRLTEEVASALRNLRDPSL